MLILRIVSKILFPIFLLFSFYLLGRGHQQIGGGFIAGVMIGLTVTLLYVGVSRDFVKKGFNIKGYYVLAFGLFLSVATGVGSFFFGFPFLTSTYGEYRIFFLGKVELASAALFDLGIFFTVFGVLLVIIDTIGQPLQEDD